MIRKNDTEERKERSMKELTMNYDLETQEGEIYPHSRALYLFDFRVHFK